MNIYLGALVYLLPSYFYVYLATITLRNNYRSAKHITASVSYVFLACWFLGSFYMLIVSPEQVKAILLYWNFPAVIIVTMLTFNLWLLNDRVYETKYSFGYKLLFLPSIALLLTQPIDGWMFRDFIIGDRISFSPGIGLFFYWVVEVSYLTIIATLLIKKLRTNHQVAKIWLIGMVLFIVWTIVMVFGQFFVKSQLNYFTYFTPHGTIFWSIAIYISMRKYDFLPSLDKQYKVLFERAPIGIIVLDKQAVIRDANPIVSNYLQIPTSQLQGKVIFDLMRVNSKEAELMKYKHIFGKQKPLQNVEYELLDKAGRVRTLMLDSDFALIDDEVVQFLMLRDITKMKKTEQQLNYLAYHDPLTGLHNRTSFQQNFIKRIRQGESFSLFMIDLDKFKEINDLYGHPVGDQVLQFIAKLLSDAVGQSGIVSRQGGDEFMLLLDHVEKTSNVKAWIEKGIETPITFQQTIHLKLSLSLGISCFPKDGLDEESLIKKADERMYAMKNNRR
ncbi:sensor domain-containing diguanylate cyclase [Halalkalibacter urbisdiaboli]|uniref:sensor domain-containing diguanylate cyclase n=1 Tax=Halalkalibacter urbisdiaboli TaxID=1960589 RepID=UPI0013FD5CA8|nr:sensor domain-containing diguanylate cyclase [Halalkalibacter urbisdiaboli]